MVQQAKALLLALQQQQQLVSAGPAAVGRLQQQLDVLPRWPLRAAARVRSCGARLPLLLLLMRLWSRCLAGAMEQVLLQQQQQQVRPGGSERCVHCVPGCGSLRKRGSSAAQVRHICLAVLLLCLQPATYRMFTVLWPVLHVDPLLSAVLAALLQAHRQAQQQQQQQLRRHPTSADTPSLHAI
jgi:hypothetical protein